MKVYLGSFSFIDGCVFNLPEIWLLVLFWWVYDQHKQDYMTRVTLKSVSTFVILTTMLRLSPQCWLHIISGQNIHLRLHSKGGKKVKNQFKEIARGERERACAVEIVKKQWVDHCLDFLDSHSLEQGPSMPCWVIWYLVAMKQFVDSSWCMIGFGS